jgi:hypothetical protein
MRISPKTPHSAEVNVGADRGWCVSAACVLSDLIRGGSIVTGSGVCLSRTAAPTLRRHSRSTTMFNDQREGEAHTALARSRRTGNLWHWVASSR